MNNKLVNIFLSFAALLASCSTNLDVTGKYKETMVVYGLLDQSLGVQYIKINKAFLGQGSAYEYAKIKDSTQFVNSLTVVLNRIKNGNIINAYHLSPDNTIPKDPGTFYAPDQVNAIYSFNSHGADVLNADSQYQLVVTNNETATKVSSQTSLISDATFISPIASSGTFGFIQPINNAFVFQVRWNSGQNAKIYQTIIRLNYVDSTVSGNIQKKLDWVFPQQTTKNLDGGEEMNNNFIGENFMQFVGNQLNDYSGLIASRALKVDILLVAGGDELNTYIEVNKPSTSIVQERPGFTNITNGLGVFSSRYSKAPFSKPLSFASLDELACGGYTKKLKFLDHNGLVCQ